MKLSARVTFVSIFVFIPYAPFFQFEKLRKLS